MKKIHVLALLAAAGFSACGGGGNDNNGADVLVLPFSSQSNAIAVTPDETRAIAVNENADSVSVFDVTVNPPVLVKEVPVGDEPVAVAVAPDSQTAYVVNQADATVSRLVNLKTNPSVADTGEVGSEPTGIAVSPTGKSLYVAELAQGRVLKLDADTLNAEASVETRAPFAVAVTNDLDQDDNDETVVVTQFYGTPQGTETQDDSRKGEVHLFRADNMASNGDVAFAPRNSGVTPQGAAAPATASPNQLYSLAVVGDKFFVPTISVSPAGPVQVRGGNLHPILLAGSVSGKNELAALSVNLEKKILDLLPTEDGKRNFLSDTTSVAFSASESDANDIVLYTLSRGGDAVQRVFVNLASNQVSIDDFDGNGKPDQIDLFPGCRTPVGIAVLQSSPKAFVNCRGTRKLVSLDLGQQAVSATVATSAAPAQGSDSFDVERGQLLYFTARGRWSSESRSDCAACHANGTLSDNVVWSFASGPRRTIPMHWTYQDRDGDGVKETQKILNWTGIFDEIRDFEGNVVNVSGGRGVLTPAKNNDVANNCASLADQDPSLLDADGNGNINAAIDGPLLITQNGFNDIGLAGAAVQLEDANSARLCAPEDWDQVDAFVKTMRSPRAPKTFGDQDLEDSIARGRALFTEAGCFKCHGGAGWTSSRLSYGQKRANTSFFAAAGFGAGQNGALVANFGVGSQNTKNIQNEGGTIGPLQSTCVLRQVATFGDPLNAAVDAIEIKNGDAAQVAQGNLNGYNVPPLLGTSLNAPFLHHGQARTLQDLLQDPSWADHLKVANAAFSLAAGQETEDLSNFLLSIDATTPAFDQADAVDVCLDLP
ncbi:MAG: YncE family protein [Deltaproteobacteria bacterium]|nr:YncE family protein [Deltaproteobacteria bacterium]